ncbi:hypothetical protein Q0M94_24795 (plasmid) [Deinococcus radiomollis]|uniref:hypothetical protein n=1 Tax=Deinococcus radiomollis TaxID=468916 RepID=UPI00389258FD
MIDNRSNRAKFSISQEKTIRSLFLELHRLQEYANGQEQRLNEMEKRAQLSWPNQLGRMQFEIEP